LALAALIIRLAVGFTCNNTHRPDEIYQYLEQAHRLVFGYGFIPWEFRYGARSWLIPFFVAGPLFLCKLVHCDQPSIYIPAVKTALSLLSISLIFSTYFIGKSLVSEKAGWLSAIFCSFWYELVYFSFRPFTDIISAYFVVAAIAFFLYKDRKAAPALFGFCNAMSLALRVQLLPVTIALLVLSVLRFHRRQFFQSMGAFAVIIVLAGFVDYLTWGQWFISYYNTVLFQWVYGVSNFWGKQEALYFFKTLLSTSAGVLPLAFLLSIFFFRNQFKLLIALVSLEVIVHSLIAHKDYRYVFMTIPFMLIIAASVITLLVEQSGPEIQKRRPVLLATLIMMAISVLGALNDLPGEKVVYPFVPIFRTQDHKLALLYVSKQNDVTGICVHSSVCNWWESGGFYYLHKDVPFYFTKNEYEVRQVAGIISYWLCSLLEPILPGFRKVTRIETVVIWQKEQAPPTYQQPKQQRLPIYSPNIPQPGIDDKYKPDVHPFLR
jgi:hypothetical protein